MAFDLDSFLTLLAGTGADALGQRQVNNRKKDLNNQMTAYNLGKSRESTAALESYLKSLEPNARATENAALKTQLGDSLNKSIDTTKSYEVGDQPFAGKVSPLYGTARARDRAAVDTRLGRTVDQLSTLGVPTQRNLADTVRYDTAAGDTSQANRAIQNMSGAYGKAAQLTVPNPFFHFAGEVLRGLGTSAAMKKKPVVTQPKPQANLAPVSDFMEE